MRQRERGNKRENEKETKLTASFQEMMPMKPRKGTFSVVCVVLSFTLSYSSRSSSSLPPKERRTGRGRSNKLNFSYPFVIQHDKEDGGVKKRWNTHLIPLLMSSCCCVVFVPSSTIPFFSVPLLLCLCHCSPSWLYLLFFSYEWNPEEDDDHDNDRRESSLWTAINLLVYLLNLYSFPGDLEGGGRDKSCYGMEWTVIVSVIQIREEVDIGLKEATYSWQR